MSNPFYKASAAFECVIMSNKVIFMVLVSMFLCNDLRSQSTKVTNPDLRLHPLFRIAMSDTANHSFLRRHDLIKLVSVQYINEKPHFVMLFYKGQKQEIFFDMSLEGDRYLLEKKYGAVSCLSAEQIDQIPWPEDDKMMALITTAFDGDSIICHGKHKSAYADPRRAMGAPARYLGEIKSLAAKISTELHQTMGEGLVVDSVLVFEGTVTKQFQLEDLSLVLGEKSVLSDLATRVLLELGENGLSVGSKVGWFPATNDRGSINARVRIFVKLEKDGSVKIETPRVLWSLVSL